jgi:hypothetical protein
MDATFKLDLAGRDEGYIRDVLDTFFETAASHGGKLIAIGMSEAMFASLDIFEGSIDGSFRGVQSPSVRGLREASVRPLFDRNCVET